MSTTQVGSEGAVRGARALESAQLAWIAALPCAVLTALVVALLGPPIGHAFFEPGSETFWPRVPVRIEPVEHSRYVLALLGPAALAGAVLARARFTPRMHDAAARAAVLGAQAVLLAFLALCFLAQNDVVLGTTQPAWQRARYFSVATLAVAALVPVLAAVLLPRRRALAAGVMALVRESGARRVAALALALLFTALWLLTAVTTDASIATTNVDVGIHLLWSLAEPFAILNGRTPLVDFHAQYGQLVPYLAAAVMALFGATVGVYTIAMATLSGLALLAVYALLRRVARSSLVALALYAPFVATGFFMKTGPLGDRFGPASLFPLWPIRYGGPYVLAWLLVRHVDGAAPRRAWLLFLFAGLTLANNPDFGLPAVVALAVALALARTPRSQAALGRLLSEAAGGLVAAGALVTLLTLVRAGTLPHFGWALEFSKLYGVDGWALLPMPRLGLYLVVYLTFAAAIAVAAVRWERRDLDRALTAALAWSGAFGLCAGAYFAGRSHPQVLIDLFSPWALALVLLTIAAGRALAARGWRRPQPAELAVLFGFGLLVCSLAQTPTPWSQLDRIGTRAPEPVFRQRTAAAFVAQHTRPHEPVAILIPLGHRIAYDTGRVNVSPYASTESMPTRQQLTRTIAALRQAGGSKLFVSTYFTVGEVLTALQQAGFAVADQVDAGGTAIVELVDRHGRSAAQ